MDKNRQKMVDFLLLGGKSTDKSWANIASQFGINNPNTARKIWKRFKTEHSTLVNASETLQEDIQEFEQKTNNEKGESSVKFISTKEVLLEDEIYKECKMDKTKWILTQIWHKKRSTNFVYSADFKLKKTEDKFKEEFLKVISNYKSDHKAIKKQVPTSIDKYNSCLVFNKQDAHLNKYDIGGKNNIFTRFQNIAQKTKRILDKANISTNLDKIVYILGSDEFNSEYTGMTTKGTPQQNIMDYHESFNSICYHEIEIINLLLSYSNDVEIYYLAGNHDEFVGWHLLSWLKCYYKEQKNLKFDISPSYTKYIKYSNTAICLNHGDAMSPEALAKNFPVEFKDKWSSCDNFFIFTGDKHTELSRDIGGIRFYRIPALDKSNSKWDSKNGYTCAKIEMTSFLFTEQQGLSDIYKELL